MDYLKAADVLSDLRMSLKRLVENKPNDRSELDRRMAVSITEMEKVVAYFNTYVVEKLLEESPDE